MYAQTNLQLHAQLQAQGTSAADQAAVAAAYRLAAELFSGQYRGSGKPFVAHLVGTASILASVGATTPVVIAGLLHAAYEQGDFGLGLRGRHPDKRREVVRVVGEVAEQYIQAYFQLRWSDVAIAAMQARASELSQQERDVLLVRLANELEDYLDLGLRFCANAEDRIARASQHLERQVSLARFLGQDGLAAALREALYSNQQHRLMPELQSNRGHSALMVPRSYQIRPSAALRRHLVRRPSH